MMGREQFYERVVPAACVVTEERGIGLPKIFLQVKQGSSKATEDTVRFSIARY